MRHQVGTATAFLLASLLVSLLAVASCSGSEEEGGAGTGSGTAGGGAGAGSGAEPGAAASADASAAAMYFVLESPGWELNEAIDYRAGLGRLADFEPDLDWFAEYDGPRTDGEEGAFVIPSVSVSAHGVGLAGRGEQVRLPLEPTEAAGRKALAGQGRNGPRIVILDVGADYSVEILSYDLPLDALRGLAGELRSVDEQGWLDHGGVVLDCVPFEPGCEGPGD